MDVIIQGHDLKVTDALEIYTRKKLDRLDRYLPNITELRVDLSHERTKRGEDLAIAQITIRHIRGAILRAQEKSPGDINSAINSAVDKMYRQIQRFKGKHIRKGRERFTATIEELNTAEQIPDVEEFVEEPQLENGQQNEIMRRKEVAVAAMNEAEAVEQMELLGHSFFMFFNATTGSVNVLYKRTSGGYGVLVPRVE
ncbi:MAG: ribosome-associated translation inhibitor RaiA [Anaerolineae bacterium]|nr:ribosome-associated translation inhibitor RaiA [Anaerolineae bacterium]